MKNIKTIVILFLLCASFFLISFYLTIGFFTPIKKTKGEVLVESARSLQEAFAKVAEKALPAVVVVKTSIRRTICQKGVYDPLLRKWSAGKTRDMLIPYGQGSGFFITDQGHIVTNWHIVKGQSEFTVILKNGEKHSAKVVGVDPKVDLAVIKIDLDRKTPFLKFADVKKVKTGHWAIAIGAPFALDYTVTAGIVSNIGRDVGMNVYENYIQTDAAINPGNSGGPLLNLDGEVIGVNDFIMTSSSKGGGSMGLSFAIASDLTEHVVKQLIEKGEVARAWLGIAMSDITDELAVQLGMLEGVIVTAVHPDDPAERAGIKKGDIILGAAGKKIRNSKEFQKAILAYKPGDRIKLLIRRLSGKEMDVEVIAGRQNNFEMDGESVSPSQ
jgi:serine protease Do